MTAASSGFRAALRLPPGAGRELRVFETARAFTGSNGVDGHGGSIDVGSAVIQGDHLFIVSGYSMFGQMPGNMLLAYALPPRKDSSNE